MFLLLLLLCNSISSASFFDVIYLCRCRCRRCWCDVCFVLVRNVHMQIYDIYVAFLLTTTKWQMINLHSPHTYTQNTTEKSICTRKLQHQPNLIIIAHRATATNRNNDLWTIFSKSTPMMTRSAHNCKYCFIFIDICCCCFFPLHSQYIYFFLFCAVNWKFVATKRNEHQKNECERKW